MHEKGSHNSSNIQIMPYVLIGTYSFRCNRVKLITEILTQINVSDRIFMF